MQNFAAPLWKTLIVIVRGSTQLTYFVLALCINWQKVLRCNQGGFVSEQTSEAVSTDERAFVAIKFFAIFFHRKNTDIHLKLAGQKEPWKNKKYSDVQNERERSSSNNLPKTKNVTTLQLNTVELNRAPKESNASNPSSLSWEKERKRGECSPKLFCPWWKKVKCTWVATQVLVVGRAPSYPYSKTKKIFGAENLFVVPNAVIYHRRLSICIAYNSPCPPLCSVKDAIYKHCWRLVSLDITDMSVHTRGSLEMSIVDNRASGVIVLSLQVEEVLHYRQKRLGECAPHMIRITTTVWEAVDSPVQLLMRTATTRGPPLLNTNQSAWSTHVPPTPAWKNQTLMLAVLGERQRHTVSVFLSIIHTRAFRLQKSSKRVAVGTENLDRKQEETSARIPRRLPKCWRLTVSISPSTTRKYYPKGTLVSFCCSCRFRWIQLAAKLYL